MKSILTLGVSIFLVAASTVTLAADTKTSMDTNWICSTNASSSDAAGDKAADDRMATNASSAADAFSFAATNCRDCTKITCEIKD